jgi:S-adenosylmethionine decarboxylase proenzyme
LILEYEMFQDYISAGKHMICDFKNIQNELLHDKTKLQDLCREICSTNNFTILGELEHTFLPQGFSFIFLLSESHLSIHTFPEKQYLSFDLYTCRQYENNHIYMKIYERLNEELNASNSEYKIIDRNF